MNQNRCPLALTLSRRYARYPAPVPRSRKSRNPPAPIVLTNPDAAKKCLLPHLVVVAGVPEHDEPGNDVGVEERRTVGTQLEIVHRLEIRIEAVRVDAAHLPAEPLDELVSPAKGLS